MAKFRSPFNKNELIVTQTYHTQSNNTAVDFSAVAETPVYAVADGVVTYRSSGAGSYCIQTLDNSDLKVYYVHTYKWVGANTRVKRGQIICYVAPTSVNGGHPTHLHLGLQVGRYLMDYMDRSIVIKAGFTWGSANNIAIRNAWFNGGGVFDWGKHKDLSYSNTTMLKIGDRAELTAETRLRRGSSINEPIKTLVSKGAVGEIIGGPRTADGYEWWDIKFLLDNQGWMANPSGTRLVKTSKNITQTDGKMPIPPTSPPEPPSETECEKRVIRLEEENEGLKTQVRDLISGKEMLISQNKGLSEQMVKYQSERDAYKLEAKEWSEKYGSLKIQHSTLENDNMELVRENAELRLKLEEGNKNFIKKITDFIGGLLAKITSDE